MSNIGKPASMIRMEFISALTDLINNSNLPLFIIEPILKDMYTDVRIASQKQTEEEIKQYQKSIEQNTSDN